MSTFVPARSLTTAAGTVTGFYLHNGRIINTFTWLLVCLGIFFSIFFKSLINHRDDVWIGVGATEREITFSRRLGLKHP